MLPLLLKDSGVSLKLTKQQQATAIKPPLAATMSTSAISGFYAYTQTLKGVYYGPGSVKDSLISILEGFGTKKVLIITGKSLREKVRGTPCLGTGRATNRT